MTRCRAFCHRCGGCAAADWTCDCDYARCMCGEGSTVSYLPAVDDYDADELGLDPEEEFDA